MKRTRSTTGRNAASGNKKKCAAILHNDRDSSDDQQRFISIRHGKKIKAETLELMYSHDPPILSRTAGYICHSCYNLFTGTSLRKPAKQTDHAVTATSIPSGNEHDDQSVSLNDDDDQDDDVCPMNTSSSNLDFNSAAGGVALPEDVEQCIQDDIYKVLLKGDKINVQSVSQYRASLWLRERPQSLVIHFSKLLGYSYSDVFEDERKASRVAKMLELVYSSRNSRLVLPQSFREGMLLYNVSGSRLLVDYNGSVSAGGSYTYLLSALKEASRLPLPVPRGIVRAVIDNEQVVGKRYKVNVRNSVPVSVITSKIYIVSDQDSSIQSNSKVVPSNWMFAELTQEQRVSIITGLTEQENTLFREARNDLLSLRIESVAKERPGVGAKDHVDVVIEQMNLVSTEKVCVDCGAENAISSRLCTNCKGRLQRPTVDLNILPGNIDPYEHLEYTVDTQENHCRISIGEPEIVNPNSFETLSQILRNIGKEAGISQYGGKTREWIFLECDGGIYPIIMKLIVNVLYCSQCKQSFYGNACYEEHVCSVNMVKVDAIHEFSWIVLMPGLLHMEMNGARALLELCWEPFLKDVVKVLGFESPRAQEFAKKGSDHHKTWAIIEILSVALTDELLVPYIDHCRTNSAKPNVDGYWEYCENVKNPNYLFAQQIALTFLQSLLLFRNGVRKRNATAMQAAKAKMAPLFFGRKHPTYQRIIAADKCLIEKMPSTVKEIIFETFSLSRTSSIGHYQGGDACLEEVNKEAKTWTPPGVPTDDQWIRIFRNLEELNKVRSATLSDAGQGNTTGSDKQPCKRCTISNREITAVRSLFRRHGYLQDSMEERTHTSVTGEVKLSEGLRNFTVLSVKNMQEYMMGYIDDNSVVIQPVFKTKEEETEQKRITNMTKDQLRRNIMEALEKLSEPGLMEDYFHKSVSKKSKSDYEAFFQEVLDKVALEQCGELDTEMETAS